MRGKIEPGGFKILCSLRSSQDSEKVFGTDDVIETYSQWVRLRQRQNLPIPVNTKVEIGTGTVSEGNSRVRVPAVRLVCRTSLNPKRTAMMAASLGTALGLKFEQIRMDAHLEEGSFILERATSNSVH